MFWFYAVVNHGEGMINGTPNLRLPIVSHEEHLRLYGILILLSDYNHVSRYLTPVQNHQIRRPELKKLEQPIQDNNLHADPESQPFIQTGNY